MRGERKDTKDMEIKVKGREPKNKGRILKRSANVKTVQS
jgi:hypothetical protein